jgi:HEXXH motif-containing protein
LISALRLPEAAFTSLAAGEGTPLAIGSLWEAQRSKQLMLLGAVSEAVDETRVSSRETAAFRAGYELLARIQRTDPGAGRWLLSLPHVGSWLHDCLIHLDRGTAPDFAYLACAVAAAAVRAGIAFELDIPVRDDRALLPGLGYLSAVDGEAWVRLRGDGDRLTAGGRPELARCDLVPDYGPGPSHPRWHGTPAVRALADGLTWDVLLETADPYLDRYSLPMSAQLPPAGFRHWQQRLQSAWEVLVQHHRRAAEAVTEGISVVVPLTAPSDTDLISATSPAAFGAIATSWPPDAVTLAETIVHEFQHVKLCGLMDMVPLTESGQQKVYAPWRPDPRPVAGLLQGIYAHLGIVRFWRAQRQVETNPDDVFRAHVQYARWRSSVDVAVGTLRQTGCLTPAGMRFVDIVQAQELALPPEPVPGDAHELAREIALDHRLTWQFRHVAHDAAEVARLAGRYRQGEACPADRSPRVWVRDDTREAGPDVRSRMLSLRYLAPARYREVYADGSVAISEPDRLLLGRQGNLAVQAYRDRITGSRHPQPDAWIGLALASHQLPPSPVQDALASRLALIFDVHSHLGGTDDPLALASWFA